MTAHSSEQTPTHPPAAILAGCGELGSRVGLRLATHGYRVLGLRRNPRRVPAPIEGHGVDLSHRMPRLAPDTRIVVVALSADIRTAQGYRDTYLRGLEHLLDAVEQQLPHRPRTLLVSSTAVYGTSDGSWVDEHTRAVPTSPTATVLREAEDILHSRLPGSCVLRLGGLYGGDRGTLLSTVIAGTATIPNTPVYTNRIHRDDAAAAIAHLTTAAFTPEPVYLGVDDEPAERGDLLRFLADELGVAHPPVAEEPTGRGRGKRCRNQRLRSSGFTFNYPTYREGYRATMQAL